MSSGWRGMLTGALALVAIELLVQPTSASNVSGLFGLPAQWIGSFLDPTTPTFKAAAATSTKPNPYTTGGVSTTPPTVKPGQPKIGGALTGGGGGSDNGDLLPQLLPGQKQYGIPQQAQ